MKRHELLQTEPSTLVEMVLNLEQENSKLKKILDRIDEMATTGNESISLNELMDFDKYGQILCSVAQCVGANNETKAQAIEEYESSRWIKFDPQDKSTWPDDMQEVLTSEDQIVWWDAGYEQWSSEYSYDIHTFTHWQPLPKPPEDKE